MERRTFNKIAGLALLGLVPALGACNKLESILNQKGKKAPEARKEEPAPKKIDPKEREEQEARETILTYLSQPAFSNSDLGKQVTRTNAVLELYNLDEGMVYFSMRAVQKPEYELVLSRLAKERGAVEFAQEKNGRLELGDYVWNNPKRYFFRFPAKDFKVNPKTVIKKRLGEFEYRVTIPELGRYLKNENTYNGYLQAVAGVARDGRRIVFHNHGAFVSKKEASLERLVKQVVSAGDSKETKAQKLLDFVTENIEYNKEEANQDIETLKKANEVLMSGNSDCSGHVIVYASLLEQVGADYQICYVATDRGSVGHITVAVNWDLPINNGMGFNIGGKNYAIAETTSEGFRIGESFFDGRPSITLDDISFFQKPGVDGKIYDKTGHALEWT